MQELDLVEEGSVVYKLIGPALIRQDLVEANANVSKRLEFIGGELARLLKQQRVPQEKLQRAQEQARAAPCSVFNIFEVEPTLLLGSGLAMPAACSTCWEAEDSLFRDLRLRWSTAWRLQGCILQGCTSRVCSLRSNH